ncbi:HNH endonuclease [Phyllobacterium sp. 22229]|uniref:HNH endonuclease n=1 Tax=Phyllobacterium sp. 22229 TaxID=3453895 RepID=UPI003F84D5D5
MARTVSEWVARNDDAKIPNGVKQRIVDRQGGCCALSGKVFGPGNKPEFDHKVALWLGGEHREGNLHAICKEEHKAKTAAEATVRAKVNSNRQKHLGITVPKGTIKSPGFLKAAKADHSLTKPLPPRVRDVFGRNIARQS